MQHKPPASVTPPTKPPPKPKDSRRSVQSPLPRFDQALREACNRKRVIILSLAVPISMPNDQGSSHTDLDVLEGQILEADTYAIKIRLTRPIEGREVWVNKAHIAATYIVS